MIENKKWLDKLNDHYESVPILNSTTDVGGKERDSIWQTVCELYRDSDEDGRVEPKVMASVVNAILTQNRHYFCLTREKTRELVLSDRNHYRQVGFDNNAWRRILSFLIKGVGIISCAREGEGRQPAIYQTSDDWIREHISHGDPEEQYHQCIEFVTRTGRFEKQTDKRKEKT